MAKVKCKQHNSGIGGQAVLEGVMMRRGDDYAVAIRKPDKTVTVSKETYHGILEGSILKKTPFVRGVFVFLDSLILGMRITSYSASFYEEEEEDTKKDQTPEQAARSEKMDKIMEGAVTVVAFVIAIGLFFVLPYLISALLSRFIHHPFLTAVIEGLLRIGIFMGYILAISMMEDIRRLFQYHGAEHKCINCLEHGLPLNVENVRGSTRFHKRCGTSFILFVMLVSIVLFFFIRVDNPMLRILLRILLIPVISGISFELIRLAGSSDNPVISLLSKPGIWFQNLTTREPDDDMIRVGIASVEAVFDWRDYLRREFGVQTEAPEEARTA